MSFRLTLSLTFASSHSDNPSKGVLRAMNHWISDEAERAVAEDEARARRDKLFSQQASGLWADLQHEIQQDVEKINQNQELLSRRLDGEKLRFNDLGDGELEVVKLVFPTVCLTIVNRGRYISVEREITTNRQARGSKKERENLDIELDSNDRLFLRNAQGDDLRVSEASQYLLTPLLRSTK